LLASWHNQWWYTFSLAVELGALRETAVRAIADLVSLGRIGAREAREAVAFAALAVGEGVYHDAAAWCSAHACNFFFLIFFFSLNCGVIITLPRLGTACWLTTIFYINKMCIVLFFNRPYIEILYGKIRVAASEVSHEFVVALV
jgi:hypothetical protein